MVTNKKTRKTFIKPCIVGMWQFNFPGTVESFFLPVLSIPFYSYLYYNPAMKNEETFKIKLGISSCLLGQQVRYDGGHKLDLYLRDVLGQTVEYVTVCPEVGMGLGTPRETIRLKGDPLKPKLVNSGTGIDHTDKMSAWMTMKLDLLAEQNLSGFIFKSQSPSCGKKDIKVYDNDGRFGLTGTGVFARAVMVRFPGLPVEEESRLQDSSSREDFMKRVISYHRRHYT